MTYTIELSGPLEERVHQAAAEMGCDISSYLQRLVTEGVADENESPAVEPSAARAERVQQRLQAWSARFPLRPQPIDDSRESIYAGRGE